MRTTRCLVLLMLACVGATVRSAVAANQAEQPDRVARGEFIPTFAVKYGGTSGWPPREDAARFDLLNVSASVGYSRVFTSEHGNTWQTLKHLNPYLSIFLYQNGPW